MVAERVTQLPIRTLIVPTDQNARVTQLPIRTLVLPTDQNARVTQLVLRVLRLNKPSGAKGGGGGAFMHNPFGMPQSKKGNPPGRRQPPTPRPPPQIRWIKQPCDPSQGNDCK